MSGNSVLADDYGNDLNTMPAEDVCVELEIGEPPPEALDFAIKELGENPDTRSTSIQELRDMIYERGECTPHRMDDLFLLRFLRARLFVVERAHKLMVNYYQFKEDNPELHKDIYPMEMTHIGDAAVLSVPPYRDQNNRRLMFYRIGQWDPSAYSIDELFKATVFVMELGILEPRVQIYGGVALFDLKDISMSHAWQITPSVAAKIVQLIVSCFPMRTHAIHMVNHSWIFDYIYSIFKPFLGQRMRERIYFHGYNMESLHRHVQPKYLPERYGGTRPDYPYDIWLEPLKRNVTIVKEMLALGYLVDPKDLPEELKNPTTKKDNNDDRDPKEALSENDPSIRTGCDIISP